eukprot:SAG31_NODE_713_length_12651_cov_180.009481_13_plen_205_part_00
MPLIAKPTGKTVPASVFFGGRSESELRTVASEACGCGAPTAVVPSPLRWARQPARAPHLGWLSVGDGLGGARSAVAKMVGARSARRPRRHRRAPKFRGPRAREERASRCLGCSRGGGGGGGGGGCSHVIAGARHRPRPRGNGNAILWKAISRWRPSGAEARRRRWLGRSRGCLAGLGVMLRPQCTVTDRQGSGSGGATWGRAID